MDTDQTDCMAQAVPPPELSSSDPEVLRSALLREHDARRRADCLAAMQTEVVQLALDLLVREPDIEGFFGGLTKTMVEDTGSAGCAVWLLDDERTECELWMAYFGDRLYTRRGGELERLRFPHELFARHLMTFSEGWSKTIAYVEDDPRLPGELNQLHRGKGVMVVTPLVLGTTTLGWIKLSCLTVPDCADAEWWRIVLIEAIARQAALALHHHRVVERSRVEERRKATLEERNRLARDIHDNLAQGFGAILMQLQAAQRDTHLPPTVAATLDVAVNLARNHMVEARRSVGTLRPNVGDAEEMAIALKRIADRAQLSTSTPIETTFEPLPRYGDVVEREIIGIAQEALTNAVRHSRARRITVRASTIRSLGLRLSIADDGRGISREKTTSGFGMTSMQERAARIGASLTIVTAPRSGTEVVLAWEPSSLPTRIHVAS
ncbi:MAG TPA: GAF domain-containing sensor histidine kinase [Vicinamibacterales bacterium]|nr:GAF domain-containing sensor histidine kinase [Vicinamibacterales bacterium]